VQGRPAGVIGGRSAVDTTAGQILDLIRVRQLNVGDVLPTERELSELVGASRNTVRDHLKALTKSGHLTLHGAGRGAWYGLL